MPAKVDGIKPPFVPIGGLEGFPSRKPLIPQKGAAQFRELLLEKMAEEQKVKFSAHAKTRIASRAIELTPEGVGKIASALDQAKDKGAHDSLIFMDDMAFIANVDNRTIITAVDELSMKENVFTNIDSAVIVK